MTISDLIVDVAEALPRECRNDFPAIRQALNDGVDHAVRAGEMTERQANNWSQDRAVKRVQKLLTEK